VGIPIELCLKSNQRQSIRTKENVQCDIKFQLTENKLKPIESIQFKVKLYREKKNRGTFPIQLNILILQLTVYDSPTMKGCRNYTAHYSVLFLCVLNLTAWDHLGVGMKTLMGIKKRRFSR
jgi:hypothetical protein